MTDLEKPKAEGPPESPTTARELDFDDEPQETPASPIRTTTPASKPSTTTPQPGSGEDVAPPKPPRPQNPLQQAENTLKEAFPTIDASVVRAVLTASGGKVEPAFNALLGMSDPDSQKEPTPPPQPPRPTRGPTSTAQSQLEADELYARQLAEHYGGAGAYGYGPRGGSRERGPPLQKPRRETGLKPNELYDDKEHSFIDDDLPVIRENIRKGFLETQSKVNSWVANLKKKIDGDEDEEFQGPQARPSAGYTSGPAQQQYGSRRSSDFGRRSGDRDRYDADPQVLGDDFTGLQLRDNENEPPRRSTRPLANPDLFKPTPTPPPGSTRKVSFQNEDNDDLYRKSPDPAKRPSSSASKNKWQPLAAVDPSPVGDHDPFSLGDSDDEEAKKHDIKAEDSERLKKAAAEAMSDDIGSPGQKDLEPQQRTGSQGTRDKEAEEKLAGK